MGEVRTEVTLVNIADQNDADRGYMPQEQVRRLTVNAVVDTGAWMLVINEKIREKLGLTVKRTGEAIVAGGGKVPSQITDPVMVHWKDRETPCQAVVLPNEEEVLLGALPLEGMDLTVNPLRNEVTGAHGDTVRIVVK
ncbi:MAG: retroviral-like aspartic protease family protein [Treponema sp.]|jgi:clan AA aspartic protease|nr:retroviral-like aspartic protease family protein [Treponema sp.]